jgi:hypothetical protein
VRRKSEAEGEQHAEILPRRAENAQRGAGTTVAARTAARQRQTRENRDTTRAFAPIRAAVEILARNFRELLRARSSKPSQPR